MRSTVGVAIGIICTAASAAVAQPLAPPPAAAGLNRTTDPLMQAAFAPRTAATEVAPAARLLDAGGYAPGKGIVVWQTGEVQLSPAAAGGPVDSLRVNIAGALRRPLGLPTNLERSQFETEDVDVTLVRSWPAAVSLRTDALAFDVSPHAGVGFSRLGGQAEAGAMLKVSREDRAVQRLKQLGIDDGARLKDQGRWYLFAAASGRAVGLNVLRDGGQWDRAGWTTDATGALVGDAQIGLGWRRGDLQSSFGVIHREVRGQHMVFGQKTEADTLAAFSFSIRPGR